ncbi:glucose-6-phosphate isomerase [Seleniivibrio woodruffii]|uniref:Glucose-6-phosphate isomerase n=1 Tax=Seleniivibrio woodruffii TaxID=1078050 RepID=A0A4R1KCI0_9BACT|nr:glucose-6-phosphate isomerase [Seleniivibrio woodruffii]TCK60869.1 glucose-6-phosphate isomerase [Seleniivibrio woodruffii]TVZ36499.1 glucose-6-phosphate isomerase [Seleniivibrio woodruffii]
MKRIRVDYNYVMDKYIAGGLSEEQLEEYKEKAKLGLSRLLRMYDNGDAGFIGLPSQSTAPLKKFAKEINGKFNDLIVVGIGGSSLGVETVCNAMLPFGYNARSFAERGCFPRVWVADNVDPSKINSILSECQPEDTFVCIITKSGSTVETAANFGVIYEWLTTKVKNPKKQICAITDPEKGSLRAMANDKGFVSFDVQPNVGGRFSVLSPVGLVPAAILGLDIDKLLQGAMSANKDGYEQILTLSAIYMYFMDKGKNINVMMPYSSRLISFADWFCQLWGESLGKSKTKNGQHISFGTTPVRATGTIDQHSQVQLYKEGPNDKVFTFIEVLNHDKDKKIVSPYEAYDYLNGHTLGKLCNIELMGTEAALKTADRPSVKISLDIVDEYTIGALFMLWQYIVPVIGLAYDIDPFDQPGVEEGKDYAYSMLGRKGYDSTKDILTEIYKKQNDFIV